MQVDPALIVDINFVKPDHKKLHEPLLARAAATSQTSSTEHTQKDQQHSINTDNFYQALYAAIPTACIFTSVPLPESNSVTHNVTTITTSRPSDSLTNQMTDTTVESQMTDTTVENQMTDTTVENQVAEANNSAVENQMTDQVRDPSPISNVIPAPLTTTLYCDRYNHMNNEELEKESERVFCTMSISVRDAETIQRATIMQQSCEQWRKQRNGRITASIFHDVYVRKESTHPGPLLKRIMGYEQNDLSYIPAVNWGIQNETNARQQYTTVMSTRHKAFTCSLTGLWVSPLYPHIGVSPDGVTNCQCCGDGILEIKCPHSARHTDPDSLTSTTCAF